MTAKVVRAVSHWSNGREMLQDRGWLANMVETHMRPCSCIMCQNGSYDRAEHRRETAREKDFGC